MPVFAVPNKKGKITLTSNQNIPKRKGALAFLALISAFPPLSTVLYLPALPQMVKALDATQTIVNMTLSNVFFVLLSGVIVLGTT